MKIFACSRSPQLILLCCIAAIVHSCKTTQTYKIDSKISEIYLKSDGVINKKTFDKPTTKDRSAQEMESVMTLTGLTTDQIRDLGLNHFSKGKKIEKPKHAEAWFFGDGPSLDQLDWDLPGRNRLKNDHDFRESHPYFWIYVDQRRLEKKTDGTYKIDPSKDYFVDVYYDTETFDLLKNNVVVRSRVRFDDPNKVSRLLIQAKIGGGIDPVSGIKDTFKEDIREDFSGVECNDKTNCWNLINDLDKMVKSGISTFPWKKGPVQALSSVYDHLKNVDERKKNDPKTKDEPTILKGPDGEIHLQPAAAVLSRRSRYHLNKLDSSNIAAIRKYCLTAVDTLISRLKTINTPEATALAAQASLVLDPVGAHGDQIKQLLGFTKNEKIDKYVPNGQTRFGLSAKELLQAHKVAIWLYEQVKTWSEEVQKTLNLSDEDEVLIAKARIAGSLFKTYWFEQAALFATGGNATSSWSNFFIDTFDYSQSMSIAEFEKLSNNEVRWLPPFDTDLTKYKVLEASIVNEVQIELTRVTPFLQKLKSKDPDEVKVANVVVDELKALQKAFGARRFPELEEDLEDLGMSGFDWKIGTESKGQRAVGIISKVSDSLKNRSFKATGPN